ncbi:MAG TPA: hypothetical protein VFV50_12170, partial [Bdellovibrionales bacterium]|nr:hypothetical protein [Bdellovibrionales bacterium]
MAASGKPLNISKQRYIFALMRREVRWVLGPIYLATGIVDAIYRPDLAPTWIALRAVFVVVLWFAIWPLRSKRFRERYSNHFAIALTALAANIVNFMIYQSGGIHSFYHIGVILTIFAGVQVFRLTQAHAFYVSMISYSPTILINIVSAGPDDVTKALVHSTFLVTLTSLTYVMRFAEERDDSGRAARTLGLRIELEKLRRTEFLKKHFPPELRARVESGAARLERRRIVESAVVGFVDITSSTA